MSIITDREQTLFNLRAELAEVRKINLDLLKRDRGKNKKIQRLEELLDEKDRKIARMQRGHFAEI